MSRWADQDVMKNFLETPWMFETRARPMPACRRSTGPPWPSGRSSPSALTVLRCGRLSAGLQGPFNDQE